MRARFALAVAALGLLGAVVAASQSQAHADDDGAAPAGPAADDRFDAAFAALLAERSPDAYRTQAAKLVAVPGARDRLAAHAGDVGEAGLLARALVLRIDDAARADDPARRAPPGPAGDAPDLSVVFEEAGTPTVDRGPDGATLAVRFRAPWCDPRAREVVLTPADAPRVYDVLRSAHRLEPVLAETLAHLAPEAAAPALWSRLVAAFPVSSFGRATTAVDAISAGFVALGEPGAAFLDANAARPGVRPEVRAVAAAAAFEIRHADAFREWTVQLDREDRARRYRIRQVTGRSADREERPPGAPEVVWRRLRWEGRGPVTDVPTPVPLLLERAFVAGSQEELREAVATGSTERDPSGLALSLTRQAATAAEADPLGTGTLPAPFPLADTALDLLGDRRDPALPSIARTWFDRLGGTSLDWTLAEALLVHGGDDARAAAADLAARREVDPDTADFVRAWIAAADPAALLAGPHRLRAARTLVRRGDARGVAAIVEARGSGDADLRHAAGPGLADVVRLGTAAVPELERLAHDERLGVRVAAEAALVRIRAPDVARRNAVAWDVAHRFPPDILPDDVSDFDRRGGWWASAAGADAAPLLEDAALGGSMDAAFALAHLRLPRSRPVVEAVAARGAFGAADALRVYGGAELDGPR